MPATSPGLVQSIQLGDERDSFLAYVEDELHLRLLRYRGLAGFKEEASALLPGARLLGALQLPLRTRINPVPVLVLATPPPYPGLFLLEMRMAGDPAPRDHKLRDVCSSEDHY